MKLNEIIDKTGVGFSIVGALVAAVTIFHSFVSQTAKDNEIVQLKPIEQAL